LRQKEMKRLKLLFLVTEDWYFCSHRLHLAVAAKMAGYDVSVATRVSKHKTIIEEAGIQLFPLQMSRSSMRLGKEICTLKELIRVYRQVRPDIVHHVALKPVLYGSIVARFTRVPHVVNALAGLGFVFSSNKAMAKILRPWLRISFRVLLNSKGSRIIVQNSDDQYMLVASQTVSPKRITMIRSSGVDIHHFTPLPEPKNGPIVFTLVGRMLRDKGIFEFVEAARILHHHGAKFRAVLVGKPDAENPAAIPEAQLHAWQNSGCVEWWGHRDDILQVWKQSHVAVLPSYREGLPKSLLEAAACARPIIATDVPGCREIVQQGKNGLLVPACNAAELADAMCKLLHDVDLRKRMGQAGSSMVKRHFSEQCVADQTLRLYRELCMNNNH